MAERQTHLDPEVHALSPYDQERMVPPTLAELVQMGLTPAADETLIQVNTRIRPDMAYAIDRIIEKRVYNLKSRQEFFRLAIMNLVKELVDEIQQQHVKTLVHRLDAQRRLVGELLQMRHVTEMIEATTRVVSMFLQYDNQVDAIKALKNAKHFMEEIPFVGLRERFKNSLYGSQDGLQRPEQWEESPSAALWDKVLAGEFEREGEEDDTVEEMKVY